MKIIVNNLTLDIPISEKLRFDSTVFSLTNGSIRTLPVTKTIKIGDTRNNRIAFRFSDNFREDKVDFNKLYPAIIFEDTITFNGDVKLIEFSENKGGKIIVIIELSQAINNLKKPIKKLLESTIDSFDFEFNQTNYNILKDITDDIWCWPALQTGEDTIAIEPGAPSGALLSLQRPCFRVKSLIEKIAEELKLEINISSTDILEYDSILITSFHDNFILCNYEKVFTNTDVFSNISGDVALEDMSDFNFEKDVAGNLSSIVIPSNLEVAIVLRIENAKLLGELSFKVTSSNFEFTQKIINGENYIDTGFIEANKQDQREISFFLTSDTIGSMEHTNMRLYTKIQDKELDFFDPTEFLVKTYENLKYTGSEIFNLLFGLFYSVFDSVLGNRTVNLIPFKRLKQKKVIQVSNVSKGFSFKHLKSGKTITLGFDNDSFLQNHGRFSFESISDEEGISDFIKLGFSASFENNLVAKCEIFTNGDTERSEIKPRVLFWRDETLREFKHAGFSELSFLKLKDVYFADIIKILRNGKLVEFETRLTNLESFQIVEGNLLHHPKLNNNVLPIKVTTKSNKTYKLTCVYVF